MEEDSENGEKTEQPSSYRIEQFRKRGEVASSKELTNVLVLSACVLTLGLSLIYMYETLNEFVQWIYTLDASIAYTEKSLKTIVYKIATVGLQSLAPIFVVAYCVGIISTIMQVGLLFSPEVLQFKPERINPISGLKKLFTMRSIVEAIKGIFKFVIVISIVYFMVKDNLHTFKGLLHLDFINSFLFTKFFIVKLGMSILLGLAVVAIGDFAYQKFSYQKKIMQTKEEVKRELKEQEGSPEVKQKIKMIQREIATRRMMADVPEADVIVTNPTHISIAIKYDAQTMVSPQIVAKGADKLAMRIREVAKANNVPLVENVPLARTLYKTVSVGEAVPRTLYKAIAEILAFIYRMRRKNNAISTD
ncbi:MAG: flagellar biosynthesis protein FlhB [Bacteriovoracaceae bacterium]|nr:flagellar biosynthesis protein FlhB [Bacteriovoracaceae bacterium]